MGQKIQVDEAKQAELESSIKSMKEAAQIVSDKMSQVSNALNDEIDGEAKSAMVSAIDNLKQQIQTSLENWDKIQENAKKIAEGIKDADEKLSKK